MENLSWLAIHLFATKQWPNLSFSSSKSDQLTVPAPLLARTVVLNPFLTVPCYMECTWMSWLTDDTQEGFKDTLILTVNYKKTADLFWDLFS